MHRGAWWATVHGVVKSQTRLGNRAHSLKASTGRAVAGEPRQSGHKGRGVPITGCQHCPGKPVCIFKYTYANVLFPVSTLFGRRQLSSNYNRGCLLFDKLGIFIPLTTNSGRHPQQTRYDRCRSNTGRLSGDLYAWPTPQSRDEDPIPSHSSRRGSIVDPLGAHGELLIPRERSHANTPQGSN